MSDDGRTHWTLETWLTEQDKPVNLRFLDSVIERGVDPFRLCVGGVGEDGTPARQACCDHYPIIGEKQCHACKSGVCGLCNRGNPTPFPHGRTMCRECSEGLLQSMRQWSANNRK